MSRARATTSIYHHRLPFLGRGKLPNAYWDKPGNVKKAVAVVCRETGKAPAALTWNDFESRGLSGLLQHYDSIGKVLEKAGINILPGDRDKNSPGYWRSRENRVAAVLLVRRKTRKDFHELGRRDFLRCGVGGLLRGGRTIFAVFREAGFTGEPWELGRVPNKYFANSRNRRRAVRWLAHHIHKPLGALTKDDFTKFGLSTLLTRSKPYGVAGVLAEAGGLGEYRKRRRVWAAPEDVRRALHSVLRATGKTRLGRISADDLHDNGLAGLYQHFGSMSALFRFLGIDAKSSDNPYKASPAKWRSSHGHRFKSKSERDFDDILAGVLRLGPNEHEHNVPYAPGRKFTADFVSKRDGVIFEFFGWHFMRGRTNLRRQAEYRAHVRAKLVMARKFHKTLVGLYPKSGREWVIRSNKPLAEVFKRLRIQRGTS